MDIIKMNSIDLTHGKEERPNLSTDFNTYLETKSTVTRLGYNPNIPCKIHFYEWSDLKQEKFFDDATKFIRFLSDCKIYTKYWEDNRIKSLGHSTSGVYVICKPGKTEVIIENSFEELEKSLERVKNLQSTTAVTPYPHQCVPAVVNQQVGYGGYNAYGYGHEYCGYDDYDEWD